MEEGGAEFNSRVPGMVWPALPDTLGGQLATLLYQLEQSQWWPAETLREHQVRQLRALCDHAATTVPYYRRRWSESGWSWAAGPALDPDHWAQMPLLTRQELADYGAEIRSEAPPASHGATNESQTSGSTGQPVRYLSTGLTRLMWMALTLRHHLWHRYDFSAKLCAIRPGHGAVSASEAKSADWGSPVNRLFRSGPGAVIDCRQDAQVLVGWVREHDPAYLVSLPSTVQAMAELCLERGIRFNSLHHVCTYAEMLKPETREICRAAWDVPIIDMYSCQEAGYIALQCPQCEAYHVQSESLLVEVLDESGRACEPGQIGRVVITTLHNFASPLIRYELLDYVEVGEPCACGRGLPVIRRIMGRQRNLITLPDGRRYWPVLYASAWSGIAPIRQLQLIQKTSSHFVARVVMDRPLADEEQTRLTKVLRESLGYPFSFTFERRTELIRGRNGKFESIFSEIGRRAAMETQPA